MHLWVETIARAAAAHDLFMLSFSDNTKAYVEWHLRLSQDAKESREWREGGNVKLIQHITPQNEIKMNERAEMTFKGSVKQSFSNKNCD